MEAAMKPPTKPKTGGYPMDRPDLPRWDGWRELRAYREAAGLTMTEAAALAGLPRGWAQGVECGHNTNPQLRPLLAYCAAIGIPAAVIMPEKQNLSGKLREARIGTLTPEAKALLHRIAEAGAKGIPAQEIDMHPRVRAGLLAQLVKRKLVIGSGKYPKTIYRAV